MFATFCRDTVFYRTLFFTVLKNKYPEIEQQISEIRNKK